MSMDARWKVYVQDRRFDDNQISNVYLKLKWETVGRFSFDFRPMDGDESYMVANNTLRIFWGDLHKLDGVIQRVDWDSTQWCYHIYGADIRGLLLERVNATPATVHSYTSDIQTYVMFQGCDFPTNVWTGSGDAIGKYTFKYHIGIQNPVRVTNPTGGVNVETDSDRGIVTEYGSDYIEDREKTWDVDRWKNGACRIVNGRYKNSTFRVLTSTATRLIRVGEWSVFTDVFDVTSIPDPTPLDYESGALVGGALNNAHAFTYGLTDTCPTGRQICPPDYEGQVKKVLWFQDYLREFLHNVEWVTYTVTIPGTYKYLSGNFGLPVSDLPTWGYFSVSVNGTEILHVGETELGVPIGGVVRSAIVNNYFGGPVTNPTIQILRRHTHAYFGYFELLLCDVVLHNEPALNRLPELERGTVFEVTNDKRVVTAGDLPTTAVATLQKDNHIIQYNTTTDLSEHTTSMTVRGMS